jgi:hypothetical protein
MKKMLSMLLSAIMLVSMFAAAAAVNAGAEGTVYYVDSVSGSDSNDGLSAESAWQTIEKVNSVTLAPGNSVLFKKGCTFKGTLNLEGRGDKDNPIIISSYGDGEKPLIDAATDDLDLGIVIDERGYVLDGLAVKIRNGARSRNGINVSCTYSTVKNCEVYGVDHNDLSDRITNTSSYTGPTGINVYNSSSVTIEQNYIHDIVGDGIVTNADNRASAKNLVIQNNTLNKIGQDGILINNATGALVQYNVVNESHNVSTAYHVAIWPFSSDNTVFQFNEAYNTKTTKDGHGFDCDYLCKGTLFQYNYAHDNEGGFFLICTEPTISWQEGNPPAWNEDVVVRYNIGQNNDNVQFALTGHIKNTQIYNNTMYFTSGSAITTYVRNVAQNPDLGPNGTKFYNNIFYNVNGGEYRLYYEENGHYAFAKDTVFENNCFFGAHPASEPDDPNKITADPQLVNPGGAGTGLDTCVAYQLKDTSPLIKRGRLVQDNGGRDFFGNKVSQYSRPDIGAYQSTGLSANPLPTQAPATVAPVTQAPATVAPVTQAPTTVKKTTVKKPYKVRGLKLKAGKKRVTVTFKKAKNAKKYIIKYSTRKNMKKAKTVTTRKLKATIKKLSSRKRIYVQVQGVNGKVKGKWSVKRSVRVK